MFPTGVTHITSELAFEKKDGCITYFNGHMPVFTHDEKDVATFRMITSQFCASGYAKQSDIIRAFGVTSISVKRSVKLYREKGTRGFYAPRVTRGAAVLVESVVAQIEELLAAGAGTMCAPHFALAHRRDGPASRFDNGRRLIVQVQGPDDVR